MTDKIKYTEIMWANRFLDCYTGPNFDEASAYWNCYADGDMESANIYEDLVLSLSDLPRGVRVTISVPTCPKCEEPIEMCETNKSCDFDWKEWEEGNFA